MTGLFSAIVPNLLGGILGRGFVSKILGIGKKAKEQQQLPLPTRNAAALEAERNDILARRRGLVSTAINGAQGVEATTGNSGGKTYLGT